MYPAWNTLSSHRFDRKQIQQLLAARSYRYIMNRTSLRRTLGGLTCVFASSHHSTNLDVFAFKRQYPSWLILDGESFSGSLAAHGRALQARRLRVFFLYDVPSLCITWSCDTSEGSVWPLYVSRTLRPPSVKPYVQLLCHRADLNRSLLNSMLCRLRGNSAAFGPFFLFILQKTIFWNPVSRKSSLFWLFFVGIFFASCL